MHSLYLPLQEVHSNCLLVVFGEGAFAVALDHTGLAHGSVPNDHHLRTRSAVRSHSSVPSYSNTNKANILFPQRLYLLAYKDPQATDVCETRTASIS